MVPNGMAGILVRLKIVVALLVAGFTSTAHAEIYTLAPDNDEITVSFTGAAHNLSVPFVLRYFGSGRSGPVNVDMTVSSSAAVLDALDPAPLWIGGEIGMWYRANGTSLMLENPVSATLQDQVELVAPADYVMCSILGLNFSEREAKYYATANVRRSDDPNNCEDNYNIWERWLITIDPYTGNVDMIGQTPFYVGGLAVLADGRIVVISSEQSDLPGSLYELSPIDASPTFLVTPTDARGQSEIAFRPDTNELYYFNSRRYLLSIFNTQTWSETVVDLSPPNTSRVWGGIAHFEDGLFYGTDFNGSGRVLVTWSPDGLGGYEANVLDYIAQPYTRGLVLSSLHAGSGACAANRCSLPTVAPWGGWVLPHDLEIAGDFVGDVTVKASYAGASANTLVHVVAPDLAVSATPSGIQYSGGNQVSYQLIVSNQGTASAPNSTLSFSYPVNVTYGSVSTSQGTCNNAGNTVTCNFGTIAVDGQVLVSINFTAGANGAVDTTANVATSAVEANADNNSSPQRNVIGPATDLNVTVFAEPATAAPGATVKVTVTVQNNGKSTAGDISTEMALPAAWTVAVRADGCAVPDADHVSLCTLASLAPGAKHDYVFTLTAPSVAGLASFGAEAQALTPPDLNLANNKAAQVLGVNPPTLTVALGAASPTSGATVSPEGVVLQAKLTHGGQTEQELALKSFSLNVGSLTLPENLASVELLVFEDADEDGRLGTLEARLGSAHLFRDDEGEVTVVFSDPIKLSKGQARTIGLVVALPGTQVASLEGGVALSGGAIAAAAPFAPWVLLGAFLFRRRKALPGLMLSLVVAGMAATGCAIDETSELTGTTIQVTVSKAEVSLAVGDAPPVPVEGLPLQGPKVTVK